jgi:mono/diheme cytochrome c family protein
MKAIALFVAVAAAIGAGVFWSGAYDISSTDQHLAPTYWLLDTGMRRSVALRAKSIDVPPLEDAVLVRRGAASFRRDCVQCHGAPGVAPEPFALGMTPAPANLVHTARTWAPAELYWTIKHGIKMTGMPAWTFRIDDAEIWSIVAFMRTLPALSPDAWRELSEASSVPAPRAASVDGAPDAARGKRAIHQYACATCHAIPGIVGANAPVGPPLDRMATRTFIAGALPNTRANMVRWLRAPQAVSPASAMPDLGVTERDAADIAAYLATLD